MPTSISGRRSEQGTDTKPLYSVPSMVEIAKIPWNGFNAISTFSGCGGSSLGYKIAGFKVLWANEFVPAAQETYRINHPDTVLDIRDIRTIQASDILDAIKMKAGELDLMDGSPPCQAFSTAGKREKGWGTEKRYEHGATQKNETLFDEYARLLKDIQPKVFIAENVSGLVKGTAKGYFKLILAALKDCGYQVEAQLLDAQWLGVPQMRQRIIFQGVRNDLGQKPVFPKPLPYRYSVKDALPWIVTIGTSKGFGQSEQVLSTVPYHTVGTGPQQGNGLARFVEAETDISRFAIGKEWDRLKPGEQSQKYFQLVKANPELPCNTILQSSATYRSAAAVVHPTEKRKFSIQELKRICAFPDDFILTGSYAQQWERLGNAVPPVMMFYIARVIRDDILNND